MADLINLEVKLPAVESKAYSILIGGGLINTLQFWGINFNKYDQLVIVTDSLVNELYGEALLLKLSENFKGSVVKLVFKSGEESKTAATKELLELDLLRYGIGRYSLCIAFGGGVVGDMAGFVAATYMRGIDYIQIPTTLLAMVDSAVGGKTAIDTIYGKNLIGAFWQPIAVIMDLNYLKSLPKIHVVAGLVEAIKIFLTSNELMFNFVKNNVTKILNYDQNVLQYTITEAVKLKADVVQRDEKEDNLRMILNFGHTIGHGLELVLNYQLLHGYAVAFGIVIEVKIAVALGRVNKEVLVWIINLFESLGIIDVLSSVLGYDVRHGMENDIEKVNAIEAAILHDKKNRGDEIYCILLAKIGLVSVSDHGKFVTSVSRDLIRQELCSSWL